MPCSLRYSDLCLPGFCSSLCLLATRMNLYCPTDVLAWSCTPSYYRSVWYKKSETFFLSELLTECVSLSFTRQLQHRSMVDQDQRLITTLISLRSLTSSFIVRSVVVKSSMTQPSINCETECRIKVKGEGTRCSLPSKTKVPLTWRKPCTMMSLRLFGLQQQYSAKPRSIVSLQMSTNRR